MAGTENGIINVKEGISKPFSCASGINIPIDKTNCKLKRMKHLIKLKDKAKKIIICFLGTFSEKGVRVQFFIFTFFTFCE